MLEPKRAVGAALDCAGGRKEAARALGKIGDGGRPEGARGYGMDFMDQVDGRDRIEGGQGTRGESPYVVSYILGAVGLG